MTIKLREFYETGTKVNEDPLVYVFEDFLDELEIEQLLAAAKPKLKQALVSAEKSGVPSAGRTGHNCWVAHGYNAVIEDLSLRVAEVVGVPLENAESLQVIHYSESQEYAPHFDAWDAATERGQRCMAKGGQRMITCLLYLNDVEEGGGTSFPKLDMEVRAKKGRMVLFHNCHQGSLVRHPDSLHGGMPVLKGEKWACNFWFREKMYQAPGATPTKKQDTPVSPKFKRVI
ncbi:MAG: 2OG-Fe(II) oxygenase [SAR86 cluster bacterium]|uniref:2OG-Fe(II) oxygenase n=1 Tax=SAR86 cluster bacterium TaxID=2030880 RepID=A0A2A5B7Y0_9GAMM|nr:MAG: 2OG-Fe(II) oxygenase [SAR86 cluster bacterium]